MQKKNRVGLLILVGISALAYLPMVHKIGYLNDDWYLMFDGYVGGADFFHEVYRIDRPLRGYLMSAAFTLFGLNPLYYHLSAYVLRLLSGLAFWWLGIQLWPKNWGTNFLAALLFVIYPGFLSQLNPIDYQSQIFSLACGMVSLAFTVHAIQTKNIRQRWAFTVSSILLGWVYLGLVEYFLGFEALRLACITVLFLREGNRPISQRLASALRTSLPFLAIAGGFLFWRLFLFDAERKATDVGLQISSLFSSPLTGLWWLNYLIQDTLNILLVAWAVPMNTLAFPMRLRDAWTGLGLAAFAGFLLIAGLRWGIQEQDEVQDEPRVLHERLWIALITIVAGLMPVILVNRHILFPDYSRYTLAASTGAVILLAVLLEKISVPSLRATLAGVLVALAVYTHHGNSIRAANETSATRDFWWQVAWRAPDIQEGTTLIVSYPGSPLSEDYFVWGPANWIYHSESQETIPLVVKLPSAILTDDVVLQIISNGGRETPLRRGNYLERDFGNVLVMVQSSPEGCVRVINGNAPELSPSDTQRLLLVAPYSRLEAVETDGEYHTPPADVLGQEPSHDWCYFYQKADLARQRGEWAEIPVLLREALELGHYPEDGLEWMPFLQAHAVMGDMDQVRNTIKLMTTDKFLREQVCRIMTEFMRTETVSNEIRTVIEKNACE
jgi:hypothetical protein